MVDTKTIVIKRFMALIFSYLECISYPETQMRQYRGKVQGHCMNGNTCRIFPEPMLTAATDSVCWNKSDPETLEIRSEHLDLDAGKVCAVVHSILSFIVPPVKIGIVSGLQDNPRSWAIVEAVILCS